MKISLLAALGAAENAGERKLAVYQARINPVVKHGAMERDLTERALSDAQADTPSSRRPAR
jgi:hypothetical protein